MLKFGKTEMALDGMAYFGIQSPLLKAHNVAHFINKSFDIELVKTIDFDSYATGGLVAFPCYTCVSEVEHCNYHLVGNKGAGLLFPSHPEVDFWFLVHFENGLDDHRFPKVKEKLHNELCHVEHVFSVIQAEPKKLAKHEDFLVDFWEYSTKLLQERKYRDNLNRH